MPAPRRREERTVAQLDFGGWSETAASSSEPASIQPEPVQSAQPKQRTQRGSLTTNQCVFGEWVWLNVRYLQAYTRLITECMCHVSISSLDFFFGSLVVRNGAGGPDRRSSVSYLLTYLHTYY